MDVDLTIVKSEIDIDDTYQMEADVEMSEHAMEFSSSGTLKIISEADNMITVPVNEQQSQDERDFIAKLLVDHQQLFAPSAQPNVACTFCLSTFDSEGELMQHKIHSDCSASWLQKYKCSIDTCGMVFATVSDLQAHSMHHQLNKHFCRTHCGFWCDKLEQCLEHEYRKHADKESELRCRLCEAVFCDKNRLAKHMATHLYVLRFVCALCRRDFETRQGLLLHWKFSKDPCGTVEHIDARNCDSELVACKDAANTYGNRKMPKLHTQNKGSKLNELLMCDTEIKQEPNDIEQQLDDQITIKTEPADEQELNNNNNNSSRSKAAVSTLPPLSKLRLPALKPRPVQLATPTMLRAVAGGIKTEQLGLASSIKFVPATQSKSIPITITATPMPMPMPMPAAAEVAAIAKPAPAASTTSNILKMLPSNCMVIKLPVNIKIIKLASNSSNGGPSLALTSSQSATAANNVAKSTSNAATNSASVSMPDSSMLKMKIQKVSENNRTACFSNNTIDLIDNLPESRKIIESFQSQIRCIEKSLPLPGSVLQQTKIKPKWNYATQVAMQIANEGKLKKLPPPLSPPSSLQFLLTTGVERMNELRQKLVGYSFYWICPRCAMQFAADTEMKLHLMVGHGMSMAELENLPVEVKSFKVSSEVPATPKATRPLPKLKDTEQLPQPAKSITKLNKVIKVQHFKAQPESKHAKSTKIVANKEDKEQSRPKSAATVHSIGYDRKKDGGPFPCEYCNKTFTTASSRNCHRLIHTGELPHQCNYCEKRFRTRAQVRVHHRRHTGEKPFQCKVCSLAFTHRETLISHLSRHIGMKRYKCYGCDKYFVVVSGLRAHRRNRPDTCGKVKFTARAHGPRVRVIRGEVVFEHHPAHNGYLRSADPLAILSEMSQHDTKSPEAVAAPLI